MGEGIWSPSVLMLTKSKPGRRLFNSAPVEEREIYWIVLFIGGFRSDILSEIKWKVNNNQPLALQRKSREYFPRTGAWSAQVMSYKLAHTRKYADCLSDISRIGLRLGD